MGARSLAVLMWKHGMVRVRRFIHTIVELVYPVIFFILLFSVKDLIMPPMSSNLRKYSDALHETEPLSLQYRKGVLYYPNTTFTSSLMDLVGQQLKLEQSSHLPGQNSFSKVYYPLSDESQAQNYNDYAFVMFQGMDKDVLPNNLNYTIRMYDSFNTDKYQTEDMMVGPHNQYGQVYEAFLRIQWAIDTSFIKQQTGQDIPQRLTVQEFPYYRQAENDAVDTMVPIVKPLACVSLFIAFVFLMARLLDERTTGIQELIKMVGVPVHTLGFSHFLNSLPAGLVFSIVGTILLTVTQNPMVRYSNGFLIFVAMMLYYISVVAMAFACSHLARNAQYATTISVFAYMASLIPTLVIGDYTVPAMVVPLTGLLPHMPLMWFWTEVQTLERYGRGVDFSSMWSHHNSQNCSVFLAYIFLLVQSAIFFFLAWYLSLVRPGHFGSALPWNFLCKSQYWTNNEVKPELDIEEEEEELRRDPRFFEKPPDDMEVGIRVSNVTKAFPKHVALNNVSLDVYQGEITVLLGHNGAGKTTLMSIITGMLSATEGKVFVNGKDTQTQLTEVRKHIGLCPQHNLFFPDLTVQEHIIFFTLLKHGSYSEARESATKLADKLGIRDKLGVLCKELSGGMKRRVQLACALAGGASILILDEPTSGLDVETRRELWNLLLSLRGERTVLLTTHFMEEADALGDRVAALHSGRLKCYATTMHLKRAIGTGYRLSLTTIEAPQEAEISELVTSHIKDAAVKEMTINSITYNLPASASKKFSKLFTELETRRSEFGIETIGVGVSTLEEVFLKLCSDVDSTIIDDEIETMANEQSFNRSTGLVLYAYQMCALLHRQVKYILYRKWAFLILQLLLPILMICIATKLCNFTPGPDSEPNQALVLDLATYRDVIDNRVMYNVPDDYKMDQLTKLYPTVIFEKTDNMEDFIIKKAKEDIYEYSKYVGGIELNDTDATVRFTTTTLRHAAPITLNFLTNLLATKYLPKADGRTFQLINHPSFSAHRYESKDDNQNSKGFALFVWAFIIPFIILSTLINLVSLPCKERISGTRHIHLMSGCPAELHWGTTLLFHMTLTIVTLIVPVVIAAVALEKDQIFDQPDFLGPLVVVLVLGSAAFLASMYLVSFCCAERVCSIVLVTSCILFGFVSPLVKTTLDVVGSKETKGAMYYVSCACGLVAPPHALVAGAVQAAVRAQDRALCARQPAGSCDMECYFCLEKNAPGQSMLILAIQLVVYMVMVILTQRGLFQFVCDRAFNAWYQPASPNDGSDMVRAEKAYVEKAITLPTKQISDSMLVHDVHKRYMCFPLLGKPVAAVQGTSFSIKKGECFGLLGVNGAGKSTTFKMLTAEVCPTRGNIFANGRHLGRCNSSYLRTLGYCPQFFGLDNFLTGKENLSFVLTMRGHRGKVVDEEAKTWIQIVGLEKYQNRKVEQYSGGCVRRLGAAAALCAGAELTMLDEPTAGVDVSARRRVWAALRRALRSRRSVVITSHSMDEMEALCSRIAIMSAGRVRALGSAAALRALHAAGHAVLLKIRHAPLDQVDGMDSDTDRLKEKFHKLFACTLKDEHKTMLHYHINDTLRYSDLFKQLESLKRDFPDLIEDYSVTETTLEEVFLSFAKNNAGEIP